MKCYYCKNEACAKIGISKGNIFKALLGRKCWTKTEKYVCKKHLLISILKEHYEQAKAN